MGHFRLSTNAAFAFVTLVYTEARCAACSRKLMEVPGRPMVEVRRVKKPSGRGRTLRCPRCHITNEVIEHG